MARRAPPDQRDRADSGDQLGPMRRFRSHAGHTTQIKEIGELLYWSYASLAAASVAEQRGLEQYDLKCWMVRAKLFKGLRQASMKLGSLFADVREMPSDRCAYCGAVQPPKLEGDHLIPRHRGGPESADNLVWACKPCNSSKGARDMLEWYAVRGAFPALHLVRRYLKLAIAEATAHNIMHAPLREGPEVTFSVMHIPVYYPLATTRATRSCTCESDGCSAFASFVCCHGEDFADSPDTRCGLILCGDHVRGTSLDLCPVHADAIVREEERSR